MKNSKVSQFNIYKNGKYLFTWLCSPGGGMHFEASFFQKKKSFSESSNMAQKQSITSMWVSCHTCQQNYGIFLGVYYSSIMVAGGSVEVDGGKKIVINVCNRFLL